MEVTESPKVMSNVVRGIIIGLIIIILQAVIQFGNFHINGIDFLPIIFLAIAILWSCIHYAKQMKYNVTFSNTFSYGFRTTIVAALLMIVFVVAVYIIFPDMKEDAIQRLRMKMINDGVFSVDKIEKNIATIRKIFFPINIGKILIIYSVVGLIASVLGAAVAKKNPRSI